MANLALTMASMPYDRIEALKYGLAKPEGVGLTHVAKTDVTQIAGPMIEKGAFDVGEVPLALCMMLAAKGDSPLVGLPIFPSRAFRHGCIWVNAGSNIRTPKDLEGKRIGLAQFRQVAVVWIKGYGTERNYPKLFRWKVQVPASGSGSRLLQRAVVADHPELRRGA